MADKVVQRQPKGKDSNTLKRSSRRRHSRWSLNLTALNSSVVLRQRSTTSVPASAVSTQPPLLAHVSECQTNRGPLILSLILSSD